MYGFAKNYYKKSQVFLLEKFVKNYTYDNFVSLSNLTKVSFRTSHFVHICVDVFLTKGSINILTNQYDKMLLWQLLYISFLK